MSVEEIGVSWEISASRYFFFASVAVLQDCAISRHLSISSCVLIEFSLKNGVKSSPYFSFAFSMVCLYEDSKPVAESSTSLIPTGISMPLASQYLRITSNAESIRFLYSSTVSLSDGGAYKSVRACLVESSCDSSSTNFLI